MSQERLYRSGFGKATLLFLGIPFLLLAVIGTHTSSRFAEHADRERLARLEKTLDQGVAESSLGYYLVRRLRAFGGLIRKHGPESPQALRFSEALAKEWGIPCTTYVYHQRRLVRTFPLEAPYRETFAVIMDDLHKTGEAFRVAQRDHNQALLAMFGPSNRLELLKYYQGRLRRFTRGPDRGAYLWYDFRDGYSLFFVVSQPPSFPTRFAAVRSRLPTSIGAAVPGARTWFPPVGVTDKDMQIALQKTIVEGRNQVQFAGYDWAFCQNREGIVWCCASPVPPPGIAGPGGGMVLAGYLIAAAFFFLFTLAQLEVPLGLLVTDQLEALSIRVRLILLFALATVLPLGLAVILGSIGLMDRRELLVSEAGRSSLSQLSQTEQGYRTHLERFARLATDLRDSPMVKELQLDALARKVGMLVRNNSIQRFEVRDPQGKPLFSTDDPVVHGVSQAMDMFSRVSTRRHAPNRMGAAVEKISAEELMGESMLSSDEVGLAALLRQRGRVWTFKMGTNPCLWFWDVYPNLASGPAFICVVHQLEYLYDGYISETLGDTAASPTRLAIESSDESFSTRTRPAVHSTAWLPLLQAAIRCQETGRVQFRELDLPHGRFWAAFKPEVTLKLLIFVDLVPVASRLQTLDPIKWRLGATVLFSLLVSFLGATLISSFFIVPIGDLGEGIAAIRQRDATFRIPLRRPDEFGLVAQAFNTLLGELKELQYGRVVQESLLPMNPTPPHGYAIDCLRLPATDLAGDYHDVVPLEDGRWALIMGDVTGHGISAALAMAMAKATVDYQRLTGWTVPSQVMENLNRLFYRELKPRQKFMTLCYLVLEHITGKISAENAGHPYPLHFRRATDSIAELPLPSMPLGAKKTRKGVPLATCLEPGDAILMYSDGFVECADADDKPFGYPRLSQLFHSLIRKNQPLDQILAVMEKTLREFNGPRPFPDDVTLLIIRRLPT